MRIALISDTHLEFYEKTGSVHNVMNRMLKALPDADLLIMAGDIDAKGRSVAQNYWASQYEKAIYVPGNHEYYGGVLEDTDELIEKKLAHNIDFLEGKSAEYLDRRIHGATLWTSLNNGNPVTEQIVREVMNDFRWIEHLDIAMWKYMHAQDMKYLEENVREGDIIVTHHAPSSLSTPEKYKPEIHTVGHAYYTELSEFILDVKPALWVHGHVHSYCDYMIGDTRIVCNPWGYEGEWGTNYQKNLVIEV